MHAGRCACGAVGFTATANPAVMLNCHCRDCQRATGGGYAPLVLFAASNVTVEGEVTYFGLEGNSGSSVERGFCRQCGSPVLVKLARRPDLMGVYAGALDDPSGFKPTMDIFTARAQPWDTMAPGTRKFEAEFVPQRPS